MSSTTAQQSILKKIRGETEEAMRPVVRTTRWTLTEARDLKKQIAKLQESSRQHNLTKDLTAQIEARKTIGQGFTSVVPGVSFRSQNESWVAKITKGSKRVLIGAYKTEKEAVIAIETHRALNHGT